MSRRTSSERRHMCDDIRNLSPKRATEFIVVGEQDGVQLAAVLVVGLRRAR